MPNVSAGRFGRLAWLWLSALVLVLDQASKFHFENSLSMYQQIVVIPDYFSWTLAYKNNEGEKEKKRGRESRKKKKMDEIVHKTKKFKKEQPRIE